MLMMKGWLSGTLPFASSSKDPCCQLCWQSMVPASPPFAACSGSGCLVATEEVAVAAFVELHSGAENFETLAFVRG